MASNACDCGSKLTYSKCCRPLHRGEVIADTPVRQVRARYCAFARKEVDFLWRTLHPLNEERKGDENEVRRMLRDACQTLKFSHLHLIGDRDGSVLFLSEMYEKGKDRSFLERSEFEQDAGEWKYVRGRSRPCKAEQVPSLSWERDAEGPW